MKNVFKKSVSLLMTLFMLCSVVAGNVVFADTDAQINVSSAKCYLEGASETVTIDISLANNPGIISMMLELSYDNEYLTLTNVEDFGILGSIAHGNDLNKLPYTLSWENDTVSENITTNGKIATLTFEVSKDTPEGVYPITLSYDNYSDDILDVNLKTVDFSVNTGSITVKPMKNFTGLSLEDKTYTYEFKSVE